MTTLEQSLHKYDLGHLRIVAQFWGVELATKERKETREELSEKLLQAKLASEIIEALPVSAKHALNTLRQNEGRIAWVVFSRQFGEIREMGAGKRDREKPYLTPVSAAEILFYRAFLARAFFDTPDGVIEFAYIPTDLLKIIPEEKQENHKKKGLGRLARPDERGKTILANDHILDDLTTYLAVIRLGSQKPPIPLEISPRFARDLLLASRLISPAGEIKLSAVKTFLEADRTNAREKLIQTWRTSEEINELWQIPNLICEGEWQNPILATRNAVLEFLKNIPPNKWWSLKAFIADIKERTPDFQRKAGEYDAWFIRRSKDDTPLRGFEHWDDVEGALIRYFITGVFFWLGMVDLARSEESTQISAFRSIDKDLSHPEEGTIIATSSGEISISRSAPRKARYLISRFCDWEESKDSDVYRYQITSTSLERAKEQGLKIAHLQGLLKKYATTEIPPILGQALKRWELNGTEARVETMSVLRLSKPEDLRALRESKAGRFLGEVLGPTTVAVQAGASKKIMARLIEMGIFMEDKIV